MPPVHIRRALASLAVFGALAMFAPAHAASTSIQIQIDDPEGACESWTQNGTTLTCKKAAGTSTGTPVSGAPNCTSLTADNVSGAVTVAPSKVVLLKAHCTNTDANTTYTWTNTGATSPILASTQSLQVTTKTIFTVFAKNGADASGTMSVTVDVSGDITDVQAACKVASPGYNIIEKPMKWPANSGDVETLNVTTMGVKEILVVSFTPSTSGPRGSWGIREFDAGIPFQGLGVLSTAPCDFNPAATTWHAANLNRIYTTGTRSFNVLPYYGSNLTAGTKYYINIKHERLDGTNSCTEGICPITVTLQR